MSADGARGSFQSYSEVNDVAQGTTTDHHIFANVFTHAAIQTHKKQITEERIFDIGAAGGGHETGVELPNTFRILVGKFL
jgi:hypothetical protein